MLNNINDTTKLNTITSGIPYTSFFFHLAKLYNLKQARNTKVAPWSGFHKDAFPS